MNPAIFNLNVLPTERSSPIPVICAEFVVPATRVAPNVPV